VPVGSTATKPGAAAHKTAQNKIGRYSKLASTHIFYPFSIETAGTWHEMFAAERRAATPLLPGARNCRSISPARGACAQQQTAAVDRRDRQTDRQTDGRTDRFIKPAPHIMRAVPTNTGSRFTKYFTIYHTIVFSLS